MKQLLLRGAAFCLYLLSHLIPRDKQRFACVGWHKKPGGEVFADNAKYFYLHLHKQPGIRSVWMAKSESLAEELRAAGLESYYTYTLRGVWSILRAGFIVLDAFIQPEIYALSGGAQLLQLLHGKGMKKKGYSEPQPRTQAAIFTPSPYTLEILPESFKMGARLYVTGYPRTAALLGEPIEHAEISVDSGMRAHLHELRAAGKKIVLYAPTFRRGQKQFDLSPILNLQALEQWAKDHNTHVVLSLHNKYRAQQSSGVLGGTVSYLEEGDIYPILSLFDVLVTDYSSLFADYILLDRPLIFYCYDLETYAQREGIVGDYMQITPGPKVTTFEALIQALESAICTGDPDWAAARAKARSLYHTHQDTKASERIFAILQKDFGVQSSSISAS